MKAIERLSTLAALLLLTSSAQAFQETLVLSSGTSSTTSLMNAIPGEPEPEWNCINVAIGGKQLGAIMPRFLIPGQDYTDDLLELTRKLVEETVLASTGAVGTAYANGTLAAVEFKIFTGDPNPIPAPPLRMDLTANLVSDTGQPLGTLYCFEAGQYSSRVTSLGMTEVHMAWTGPIGHGNTVGPKAVMVLGSLHQISGSLHANGSFGVTGTQHTVDGELHYGTSISVNAGSHTLGAQIQSAARLPEGLPHTAAWYLANYDYFFTGDVSIQNDGSGGMVTDGGTPVSGVIYSTGSISIDGNDIQGIATFVAEGDVEFIGNDCELLPAVDELLAYSTGAQASEGVSVYSSNSTLVGSLVAPLERVMVGGDSNDFCGQLQGNRVRVMGKQNSLSNTFRP